MIPAFHRLALSLVLGGALLGACSLNPQPIPPGVEPTGAGSAQDASFANDPTTTAQQDGGTSGTGFDSGTRIEDAAADTAPPTPWLDGGVEGAVDGSTDAEADAQLDATSD